MPSTEIHALSERIDKVLLEFFDVLDKYYQCQAMMEQNMKSGNLHMSRARYIRGVTSISSLKITEREMQASAQVECSGVGLDTVFTLVSGVGRDDREETPASETLRKRNVTKGGDDDNENKKQEKTPDDDTRSTDEDSSKNRKQKSTTKDPLSWFGVLVPQSLRYSQKNYKSTVEVCVELANLQLMIRKLQTQYQQLLEEKNVLALAEVKVSAL